MNRIVYICFVFTTALYSQLNINVSGDFNLGGDFTATETAICINASDVVLDLSGRVVSGDTDGIVVSQGLNNIVIKNGEIRNATNNGITILQNCSNIRLESITIKNVGKTALSIEGTSGNEVTQCRCENLSIIQTATGAGATTCVSVAFANDIQLRNSRFVENGAATNTISMVSLADVNRCIVEKVQFRNNTALSLTGVSCGANTQNCVFRSCSLLDNTGSIGFTGFLFNGTTSQKHICEICEISNNRVTGAATGPFYGFHVAQAQQVRLSACVVSNNTNAGAVATSHVFGFYFDQALKCSAVGCNAFYNVALNNGTSNMAAGFFIGTTGGAGTGVKNSAFVRNEAIGNASFADTLSFGFLAISGTAGNEMNAYIGNRAYMNGILSPITETQIIANQGSGSNPGGVPFNTLKSQSIDKLNGISDIVSNLRIGG